MPHLDFNNDERTPPHAVSADGGGSDLSVHMIPEMAYALLRSFGWAHVGGQWVSSSGETYWCTDEAVTIALREIAATQLTKELGL